jgi:hypothetical protein
MHSLDGRSIKSLQNFDGGNIFKSSHLNTRLKVSQWIQQLLTVLLRCVRSEALMAVTNVYCLLGCDTLQFCRILPAFRGIWNEEWCTTLQGHIPEYNNVVLKWYLLSIPRGHWKHCLSPLFMTSRPDLHKGFWYPPTILSPRIKTNVCWNIRKPFTVCAVNSWKPRVVHYTKTIWCFSAEGTRVHKGQKKRRQTAGSPLRKPRYYYLVVRCSVLIGIFEM